MVDRLIIFTLLECYSSNVLANEKKNWIILQSFYYPKENLPIVQIMRFQSECNIIYKFSLRAKIFLVIAKISFFYNGLVATSLIADLEVPGSNPGVGILFLMRRRRGIAFLPKNRWKKNGKFDGKAVSWTASQ